MEISKQNPLEKFTVSAGYEVGFHQELRSLLLQIGDTQVKLNKEECEELTKVLSGKCNKVLAFRDKSEYTAHSAIFFSSHEKQSGDLVLYTEDSIAKL